MHFKYPFFVSNIERINYINELHFLTIYLKFSNDIEQLLRNKNENIIIDDIKAN